MLGRSNEDRSKQWSHPLYHSRARRVMLKAVRDDPRTIFNKPVLNLLIISCKVNICEKTGVDIWVKGMTCTCFVHPIALRQQTVMATIIVIVGQRQWFLPPPSRFSFVFSF